jgi:hypothetical protein
MANRDTPEMVAATRLVRASSILNRHIDLRGYPWRHLAVQAFEGSGTQPVSTVMTVADLLEPLGWQLVSVSDLTSSHVTYAFFRRR